MKKPPERANNGDRTRRSTHLRGIADVDVAAIVRDAEVNGLCLVYHADRDQPAERAAANVALAALGIIVR